MKMNKRVNANSSDYIEFKQCINNIYNNPKVISMNQFIHHGNVDCLEHSMSVAYRSYLVCKKLGFDYTSASRGALLHDFYLYDWHVKGSHVGLHGFNHPNIALENAQKYFQLNEIEKDIIKKHMWPLTLRFPRFKESLIVLLVDKYCSLLEIVQIRRRKRLFKL